MKIKVDCGQKTISFAVNEGTWIQVGDLIVTKTPYYLAVSMYGKGSAVSLLKYTVSGVVIQATK